MNPTLANLFFTPQAGGVTGAPGLGLGLTGKGTGVLSAAPGGGVVDLIFARLLQETVTGQPATEAETGEENPAGAQNILSVLAPLQNDKGEQKGKSQQVHLNHILHKIAHEITATIPDTGLPPENDGDPASGLPQELQNLIAQLQEQAKDETGIAGKFSPLTDGTIAEETTTLTEPQRRNLMAFLNGLLQGIPEESRPAVIKLAPGLIRKAAQTLEFDPAGNTPATTPPVAGTNNTFTQTQTQPLPDGQLPAPALIATGLSPESLTTFMEELSRRLQEGESFIVGIVKILPPQAKQEMIFMPRALVLPPVNKNPAAPDAPQENSNTALTDGGTGEPLAVTDPLLSLLTAPAAETPAMETVTPTQPQPKKSPQDHENPLLALLAALQTETQQPHAPGQAKKITAPPVENFTASDPADDHKAGPLLPRDIVARLNALLTGSDAMDPQTDTGPQGETGFARVLKVLEEAQARNADKNPAGLEKAINVIKSMSPALSTFQGHGSFPAVGMAFASALSGDIFPDGWDWSRFNTAGSPMMMHSPAMMAASLVSQAPHATTPHPATQIVAATITRAAATGENRNITVRLEPPELGRVEIRMEFSKGKTVKTHIIAEKQETFLMLQRDAHILDRTLHDAGLDSDGGVSFELSQDGGMFDDNGRNGQRRASGGGDSSGGTEIAEEIIETRMDWYVDPDTGLTRYDIMA